MRRWGIAGVVIGQAVAIVASSHFAAGAGNVEVRVFQFRPGRVAVAAGAAVTWVNQDEIAHTVTSGTPESPGGAFAERLADKGASATVTFARPGVYPYFCRRHQAMRGEIRVQ
jgi:plastocyanin